MAKNKDPNPINPDEKERNKIQPERQDPLKAQETDIPPTAEEKRNLVEIVLEDFQAGTIAYTEWKVQKEKDILQMSAAKPSVLDGVVKKGWMSDRNLGILPGVLDIYQATLAATCYNPESIHFKDNGVNEVDNRANLEKFTKWMVNPNEVNLQPEVDDFIANRTGLGFSVFEIDWEVKHDWVDRRIPVYAEKEPGKPRRVKKYEIKTEKRRFERGRITNIDNVDDFIMASYGKHIQELPFVIKIEHIMLSEIADREKRNLIGSKFANDKKKTKSGDPTMPKLVHAPGTAANQDNLNALKSDSLGEVPVADYDGRDYPIDIYKWFGYLTRNGRREKFRVEVEPTTQTFLSIKPLRKIRRDGKFPYAGGPFRRIPGHIRGGSLTSLIAPVSNALNNNYNQTSDFQYVQNMPFGFANFEEAFTESVYEVEPGKIYPTDGDPTKAVYFPNLSRSLAWSYQDKQFLLEMLERLTGAASYFLTSDAAQATATRDKIVAEKSDTKFGIWVSRIQNDIVEAINMCVSLYQDWAPRDLAKRVIGEDGKQLIRNLSIDTLRGNYSGYMTADQTSGSKAYRAQMMMWGFQNLQQGSIWFNPQINPIGSWELTKETMLANGFDNPERFLPPKPKAASDRDDQAIQEFDRFKQGEAFDPPEADTPAVVDHYLTHMRQRETQYQELDEEYRALFDDHLFKTQVNYQKFMMKMQHEQQSAMIAAAAIHKLERFGKGAAAPATSGQPQVIPQAPAQPPQPAMNGRV